MEKPFTSPDDSRHQATVLRGDTRKSWRALSLIGRWIAALVVAFLTFVIAFHDCPYGRGDSDPVIAEFEAALSGWPGDARRGGLTSLPAVGLSQGNTLRFGNKDAPGTQRLESAATALIVPNNRLKAWAMMNKVAADYTKQHRHQGPVDFEILGFTVDGVYYAQNYDADQLTWRWQRESRWPRVGFATLWAIGAGAVAYSVSWLAVALLAFFWWFLLHRLKELRGAWKGD